MTTKQSTKKSSTKSKTQSKTNSKTRPSPNLHTSDQNVATIKTGNDKNKWIVIENKDKIKKWTKLNGKISKYTTHDNWSTPFYVVISNTVIMIFKASDFYVEKNKGKICLAKK